MTSVEAKWAMVESFTDVLFWPSIVMLILGALNTTITFKSGRRFRVKVSWFYAESMLVMMLHFLGDIATGELSSAVIDGLLFVFFAVFYRKIKDHEDKDDDDRKRRRTTKVIGEKAKAKLRELGSRLKPAPAPRPVPVRN